MSHLIGGASSYISHLGHAKDCQEILHPYLMPLFSPFVSSYSISQFSIHALIFAIPISAVTTPLPL